MHRFILLISFLFLNLTSWCQNHPNLEKTFPYGVYKTKEDFLKGLPSENPEVYLKGLPGEHLESAETNSNPIFFYYKNTNKKVKKVFAISYEGNLYIQALSILNNKNKKDKSMTTESPYCFSRVTIYGENYLYMELKIANTWKQGLGYGIGGAVGASIATNSYEIKGVVWDYSFKEFNIFRSCKDFNVFISEKLPQKILDCRNKNVNLQHIRTSIELIK